MKIVWHGRSDEQDPLKDTQQRESQIEEGQSGSRYRDWMEEVIARHESEGGFRNLPGKGKPLKFADDGSFDSMFDRIVRDAGVLPRWLELQKEIFADIQELLKLQQAQKDIAPHIDRVNEKVRLYNKECPNPLLQKPSIREDILAEALERWRST